MIIKKAFSSKKHRSIAKAIMIKRYEKSFDKINPMMDKMIGGGHRYKYGHDEEMENTILEEFGENGREVFWIHLLADRYLDECNAAAAEIVGERFKEIIAKTRPVPYYDKNYEREVLLPDDEARIEAQQQKQAEVKVEDNPFYRAGFQLFKKCLSESMAPLISALREKQLKAVSTFTVFYKKHEDIAPLYLKVLYAIAECYDIPKDKLVSDMERHIKNGMKAVGWVPETNPSPNKERVQTIMKVELGLSGANVKHQEIVTALIADGIPDIPLTEPLENIDPTEFQ